MAAVEQDGILAASALRRPDLLAWTTKLTLADESTTIAVEGDLREPGGITSDPAVRVHHMLDSGDPVARKVQSVLRAGMGRGQFMTLPEVRRFFGDMELVDPGLVIVPEWRPDARTLTVGDDPVLAMACAGVARKHVADTPAA